MSKKTVIYLQLYSKVKLNLIKIVKLTIVKYLFKEFILSFITWKVKPPSFFLLSSWFKYYLIKRGLYISSGRWRTTCRTWATSSKCWSPTIRRSSRKSSSSSMSNTKKVKSSSYKLQVSFLLTSYKSSFYLQFTSLLFYLQVQLKEQIKSIAVSRSRTLMSSKEFYSQFI